MLWRIMHEEHGLIAESTIAIALKLQRCLNGRITQHTRCTRERSAILMHAFQEEIGMIEACDGKTWLVVHLHICMEIPAELLLYPFGCW